jgi:hypothetical protein
LASDSLECVHRDGQGSLLETRFLRFRSEGHGADKCFIGGEQAISSEFPVPAQNARAVARMLPRWLSAAVVERLRMSTSGTNAVSDRVYNRARLLRDAFSQKTAE